VKWTTEKIAKLSTEEIKALRANAAQRGEGEVVRLCDEELSRRSPPRKSGKPPKSHGDSRPVLGFHFVCPMELDVRWDGSHFRTGIWAVKKKRVLTGMKIGAYVALHESKSKPSYRQGRIMSYEIKPRPGKRIPYGIDFLVEPFNDPRSWPDGGGAGEKAFYYGED
jgi:hypothetical protein